jgi:hypothetical protein
MKTIDKNRYEIAYLYFKEFTYKNPIVGERFNYEPSTSMVYRTVKDNKAKTWKVPIDTPVPNTDGLIFDRLEDKNRTWEYEAIEVEFDTIVDEKIPESEVKKIMRWEDDDDTEKNNFMHKVLFPEEYKRDDTPPDIPVIDEIKSKKTEIRRVKTNKIMGDDPFADALASLLDDYLSIVDARDGVAVVIANLMEYLTTTYSDKYTDTSSPLNTKDFLYHDLHGKSVNMFSAVKYMKRYMTSGYGKSGNPVDLYKAIHYLLFELARIKIKNLNDGTEDIGRIDGGDPEPKGGDKNTEGGDKVPKPTAKRKPGRPRKNDKES